MACINKINLLYLNKVCKAVLGKMDIREYTYFLAIVDHGSITRAAEALYISQPSLSIFLKKLEERLGFPLFSRRGSKLVLTNEGKVYADYARRITMLGRELDQYFSDLESLNRGSVRIGLTANRAVLILSNLSRIHELLPNIRIELVEASSQQLEQKIETHEIDFALLNRPFRNSELDYIPLFDEEVVVGIPSSFHVPDKVRSIEGSSYPWIDISELMEYPFILNEKGQRLRQISDYLFLSKNLTPTVYMETRSIYNIATAIRRQIGVSFLLESYISAYYLGEADAHFCSVGLSTATKLQFVIAYPTDGYLSASARKCIEILRELIPKSIQHDVRERNDP